MEYQWQKGHFSRDVKIISNGKAVGRLSYDSLFSSKKATGMINNRTYTIEKKGFFKETFIVSMKDDSFEICMNSWNTKAFLNNRFRWIINTWNTRWEWRNDSHETLVSGSENFISTKGRVIVCDSPQETDTAVLMLAGLFMHNYTSQVALIAITAAIVAALA